MLLQVQGVQAHGVIESAVEIDRRMLQKAEKSDSYLAFLNFRAATFKFDLSPAEMRFDRKLRARPLDCIISSFNLEVR